MLSSLTETAWVDSGDCALEKSGIQRLATSSQLIRSLLMALSPTSRLASERNNFTQYSYKRNNVVTIGVHISVLHLSYGVPGFATIGALSDWSQAKLHSKLDVKLVVRAMDTAGSIPEAQSHEVSGAAAVTGDLSALRRHFEISLYFLLLTGVLTLVSTGKLDLVTILALPAAMLFKGYRWWHGKGPEISNRAATWLTVAYFVFFPFDLWVISRMLAAGAQNPGLYAALLATVHLMLFATVVRLFSATTTRDYLFLTMMGFTSMLAAAILTVDPVFLVFFL